MKQDGKTARLKDMLDSTLSAFKKRLTPKEEEEFQVTSLKDVYSAIARIQKEQDTVKQLMNMPRIELFLEAMNQLGKTIEVFVNTSEIVAFIWGPVKFLLQAASVWADSFDILLDAYEQIGEEIPLLEQYTTVFNQRPEIRSVLALIYKDIQEFHKFAIRFFSGQVWRQIFRSSWKNYGSRFKHILARLSRHRGFIAEQATLLHFKQSQNDFQETRQQIKQYQQDRVVFIDHFEKEEQVETEKKYVTVLEWISAAKTERDHEGFCSERAEFLDTGVWILEHGKFQNWKGSDTPEKSILWLNGIPGAGKTILASVIIETCARDKLSNTCYFYCKETDPERDCYIAVMKGLVSQLLCQHRELVPYCYEKRQSSGELNLVSTSVAKQLLEVFIHRLTKVNVIIDGLDECSVVERKLITSFFTTLVGKCDEYSPGKLRVLFISQDYPDIQRALLGASLMTLTSTENGRDLKIYTHKRIKEIERKFDLPDSETKYIIETTLIRARGMFLFVRLVMDNFLSQTTRKELIDETKESIFPEGLGEAYERIISRIKRNTSVAQWNTAREILGWMVCARRPLKWHEIQGAFSMNLEEQIVNFEDGQLREHIKDLCGSLVQILPGDRVELVHNTAKFYVKESGFVHEGMVECSLTARCLQYLTFACFEQDVPKIQLHNLALSGYFAFEDYAVAKWFHHFQSMVGGGQAKQPQHWIMRQDLGKQDMDAQRAVDEIEFALDSFCTLYETDLMPQLIVIESEKACDSFRSFSFHANLVRVLSHIFQHQEKDFDTRNDVSIKALKEALVRNRELLEELVSSKSIPSAERDQKLRRFYGDKIFKCPRINCFYFHEGFKDGKSRDDHVNRHDRPFRCPDPDCSMVEFGFPNNRDLEKHRRSFHAEVAEEANTFASVDMDSSKTPWSCNVCGKRFTRSFAMNNHMRTHSGDRPFACPECGKAFTRANDCKRHQKIHARRR